MFLISALSFPLARLIAASILSFGILFAFAVAIALLNFGFISGSVPPSLAATCMALASLGKSLLILSHLASLEALRYSNARPINSHFL